MLDVWHSKYLATFSFLASGPRGVFSLCALRKAKSITDGHVKKYPRLSFECKKAQPVPTSPWPGWWRASEIGLHEHRIPVSPLFKIDSTAIAAIKFATPSHLTEMVDSAMQDKRQNTFMVPT